MSAIPTSIAAPAGATALCAHCRLPVPAGLVETGAEHQFCCGGCRAAWQTIHACGLESYYRLLESAGTPATPASEPTSGLEAFDSPTFHELYVTPRPGGLLACDLVLEGITCTACVWLIERLPRVAGGVIEARLSLGQSTVRIVWDPAQTRLSAIAAALQRLGYRPHPPRGQSRQLVQVRQQRRQLIHIGLAGAIMGNVMLLAFALYAGWLGDMEAEYRRLFRWLSMGLGMLSLAWPGATFFRSAWGALRLRSVNLDVPIALALLAGGAAGVFNTVFDRGEIYFDTLTVLLFLLLVGRWMQSRQQHLAHSAIELLAGMTAPTCRLVREAPAGEPRTVTEIPVEAVEPGQLLEVPAGALVPADGVIEQGRSTVNQSLLTGESTPVEFGPGEVAHAGSQNLAAALLLRVTAAGAQTRLGRLMRLVEEGLLHKPPIVRFADRVGLGFVIVVSLAAAGVFAWWARTDLTAALDHTVALLIVTCPCVLGLATPLTISLTIGRLARRGILVKSSAAVELLARGGRLLLDKTGTLTHGQLRLVNWVGDPSLRPATAALERHSSHPAARALAESQPPAEGDPACTDVRAEYGGISGRLGDGRLLRVGSAAYLRRHGVAVEEAAPAVGLSAVYIAVEGHSVARAELGDTLREDAAGALAQLRAWGWEPAILSGDHPAVVRTVAGNLGIAPARGGVSPERKLRYVRAVAARARRTGTGATAGTPAVRSNRRSSGPHATPRSVSGTPDLGASEVRLRPLPDGLNSGRTVSVLGTRSTGATAGTPAVRHIEAAFLPATGPTIMVGDGANDAAALAAADVGIAVHGGAEAALAAADVYIARPGLTNLCELLATCRRSMRLIRANFAVSAAYNLAAGTLAAVGLMHPLLAAILMPVSSATVLSVVIWTMRPGRES